MLRDRQVDAVQYLDGVVEELFDLVPENTYITITSDHGELFGEDGYFGHGPIQHEEGLRSAVSSRGSCDDRMSLPLAYIGPGAGFAFLGSFLTLLVALLLGLVSLLIWPFRMRLAALNAAARD